jgi:hypothetical protein
VAKYNENGQVQWATSFQPDYSMQNASLYTILHTSLALDASNNVYITGGYGSTSSITLLDASGTEQTPSSVTLPATNNYATFLIKYNENGQAQWATNIEANITSRGYAVTTDASNNVILASQWSDTSGNYVIPEVSGTGQAPSSYSVTNSAVSLLLIQYNPAGQVQWVTGMTGGGSTPSGTGLQSRFHGIQTDASGAIYWTGWISAASTLYDVSGTSQATSSIGILAPSNFACFIVKYSATGIAQWATIIDGTAADTGSALALDASMNIYVTGYYQSTTAAVLYNANGSGQAASSVTLGSVSSAAAFVVKYDQNGQAQWATFLNGTGADAGNGICLDGSGNIYIAGGYTSTSQVTLQNVSGTGQTASSYTLPATALTSANNGFVVKYNPSGIVQWATCTNNTTASSVLYNVSMAIDSAGNLLVGGFQSGNFVAATTLKNASGFGQTDSSYTIPLQFPDSSSLGYNTLIKYNTSGEVQWVTCARPTRATGSANGIATDASGNQYILTTMINNVPVALKDVSGTTLVDSAFVIPAVTTTTAGYQLLVKYNKDGQCQWATYITNGTFASGKLVVDGTDIYITGGYTRGSSPNPTLYDASGTTQNASAITLGLCASATTQNAYLAKYNTNGQAQWATLLKGTSASYLCLGIDLTVGSSGDIYWAGTYASLAQLFVQNVSGSTQADSTITLPAAGTTSAARGFLIKYNASGQAQWATFIPNNGSRINKLTIDASENVYIAGSAGTSGTNFNLQNASGTGQAVSGILLPFAGSFLIQYNSSGSVQWAFNLLGTSYVNSTGLSVIRDSSGNIYVGGYCQLGASVVYVNDISGASLVGLPALNGYASMIMKYNSSGQAQWATYMPLTASALPIGFNIGVTSSSIYILDRYAFSLSSGPVTNLPLKDASGVTQTDSTITIPEIRVFSGAYATVLKKYSFEGQAQWATYLDGNASILGNTIAVGPSGTLYVTGNYQSRVQTAVHDADGTGQSVSAMQLPYSLESTGIAMPFIVKYAA